MTCRVIVQVVPNDMPCHCTSGSKWHAVSLYKWFQMTCRVIVQVVPNVFKERNVAYHSANNAVPQCRRSESRNITLVCRLCADRSQDKM